MRGALLGLGLAAGCVTVKQYPLPMSAQQLEAYHEGPALAAYLTQPDASTVVCDPRAAGPHAEVFDKAARRALTVDFLSGKIPPEAWRECLADILRGADAPTAGAVLSDLIELLPRVVEDRGVETDGAKKAQLLAASRLYIERKVGVDGTREQTLDLESRLRSDMAQGKLGPVALAQVKALLDELEMEHGFVNGKVVDAKVLDELQHAGDEATLSRAMKRLPDAALRELARRCVIRLHIAASPYAEVRQDAKAIEEQLVREGFNPVSLTAHAVVAGALDLSKLPIRSVLVRQDVHDQVAQLWGTSAGRAAASVLPAVKLRHALQVRVAGISQPVTLCGHRSELDPSPCIAPADVKLDSPLAMLDRDGAFHFVDSITEADAMALAQPGNQLTLPVEVGGKPVAALRWSLRYQVPPDLVFTGSEPAGAGPNLAVEVDRPDAARLFYTVDIGQQVFRAVVEWPDASLFHVVSRGGQGAAGEDGADGSDGAAGMNGSDASCPSTSATDGERGDDGSPGSAGGPGGPGGPGGAVRVRVIAPGPWHDATIAVIRNQVLSVGGAGGAGGRGGAGGAGGAGGEGGMAATCTDSDGSTFSLPGGSSGPNGNAGPDGSDGANGPPGPPGPVEILDATPAPSGARAGGPGGSALAARAR